MPDDGAAGSSAAAPPSLARGDIIWGKCRGFPWWPCEIRSVRELKKPEPADGKEHKVRVRFLSTKDNAEVGVNSCVRPFPDNVAELSVVKKGMFKSPGLRMKFEAAVLEAVQRQESGAAAEGPWSDDDAVDEEEVLEAMQEAKAHLDAWKTSGHDLIGKHVARYFGPATLDGGKTAKLKKRKAYLAVITRWLPAEDGDLFHAVHDDGDEEDLEEHEARKSGALYNRQPEAQRKKHEILCAKRERQLKAEAKARLPKKPLSAYHLFGADARAELAQTQPGLPPPEVLKRIAALWRELPDADRAEYDHKASEEVKRYVSECEAQGIDPGKAARLASGPEPPLSALGFFQARCEAAMGVSLSVKCVSEQLASEVDGMPKSVAKLLQAGFDALSYEERDELDDLAAIDAERYEEELAAYQAAAAKRRKTGAGGSQARGEGAAAADDDDAGADEVDAPSAAAAAAADSSQVVVKVRGVKRPRG